MPEDVGAYACLVGNSCGELESTTALLSISDLEAVFDSGAPAQGLTPVSLSLTLVCAGSNAEISG